MPKPMPVEMIPSRSKIASWSFSASSTAGDSAQMATSSMMAPSFVVDLRSLTRSADRKLRMSIIETLPRQRLPRSSERSGRDRARRE